MRRDIARQAVFAPPCESTNIPPDGFHPSQKDIELPRTIHPSLTASPCIRLVQDLFIRI